MKKISIARLVTAPARSAIVCGMIFAASTAWADDEVRCTNRTLLGDYGFHVDGIVLAIPGLVLPPSGVPIRGVAMSHFDGKGNMTQVDHIVVGGTPPPIPWTPGTATYTVNPDCTGTWVLTIPGSPLSPVRVSFVVTKSGKEIRTVVESNAVTSIGTKTD